MMQVFLRSVTLLLMCAATLRAQAATAPAAQSVPRVRISGFIRALASREVVRRAQLAVDNGAVRGQSNEDGFYSLLVTPGTHTLRVRAIGFAPYDTTVTLTGTVTRDILLDARKVTLAAVRVQADARKNPDDRPDLDPKTPDMSVVRLDLAAVKLLPPLLGEADPVRSLTLLPGVTLSSDASTAFSVRGGAADQNLFLLDEATIYNPAHLLGFISTFNADAVDNVTLYKGAIPSKFGGRLSSVIDVRQKEGNANEFAGSAGIGLLSSRGLMEGPLPKSVGSWMIAGRRSYVDLFTPLASDSNVRQSKLNFYDINAKSNVRLGETGSLFLSGYLGRDSFGQRRQAGASWGNSALTFRWNQAFSGRLFHKFTTAFGDYDYQLDFPLTGRDSVRWTSRIRNLDVKVDETYYLSPNNSIEFGLQYTDQDFRPGTIGPRGPNPSITRREISPRFAVGTAAYIGHEVKLFDDRIGLRYGVRYAGFERRGASTIYRYRNDQPVVFNRTLARYDRGEVIDSTLYRSGQRIASFGGWEPRFSGRVSLNDISSVKFSYARTQQFLSLASQTNSVTPLDVWEPSGPYIKPQVADQVALGYSRTTANYELSSEVYFKASTNAIDFIDGADVVLNPRIETLVVQGDGRAYGLELLARRNTGTVTGWISYTLARAEQRFRAPASAGGVPGAGINGGDWYPNPFDKTHNLAVVAIRPLGKKWTLGSTFTLATGLPATYPDARYTLEGVVIADFGRRNSARLPLYHRLDLSATRKYANGGELQLAVLNLYNRFNAQAVNFRQVAGSPLRSEAVQTSIFGILPSITYVFHF
jgi:hypothetical protein